MNRKKLIETLISEGFTEKTLSRMTDKELTAISERIVTTAKALKTNPEIQAIANDPNTSVEIQEKDNEEVEEWVVNVAESKFTNFTSKSEIMEIIQTKVGETFKPMPATKATKGHNGVPEFMSFDAIVAAEPATKPAEPITKPDTPTKPKTPYEPGPGTNPKPKALREKK
jgi:hypothetical protein